MNALTIHQPQVPSFEVGDIWKMAQAVAASGLFGMKRPEEAMALMLVAQAEGTHPALAARDYHIVDGRPTLKADAMLARFMQAGGKVEWHAYDDEAVKATFSHPQGGKVTIDWTLKRASQITRKGKKLTDGDNWKNYPRAMLRARVISEGIRTVFPGCVVGVYTPEEVQDFDDQPSRGRAEVRTPAPAPIDTTAIEVEVAQIEQPRKATAKPMCGALKAAKPHIDALKTIDEIKDWEVANEAALRKLSNEDYVEVMSYLRTHEAKLLAGAGATDFGDLDDAAETLAHKDAA